MWLPGPQSELAWMAEALVNLLAPRNSSLLVTVACLPFISFWRMPFPILPPFCIYHGAFWPTYTLASLPLHWHFMKIFLTLYLFERQMTEIGRTEEIFHLLIIPQNGTTSQFWVRPEPIAKNSMLIYLGGRDPSPWAIFFNLPRCLNRELDWKESSWDKNQCSYEMPAFQADA